MKENKPKDPSRYILSRMNYTRVDQGVVDAPDPIAFSEQVEELRGALKVELSKKVEERSSKTQILASEAGVISFLLDEFSARIRLQMEKGDVSEDAESLAKLSDDMSRILFSSLWEGE